MNYREYQLNAIVDIDNRTQVFEPAQAKARAKAMPDNFSRKGTIPVFDQQWIGSCVGASGKVVIRDNCFPLLDLSAIWIYLQAKKRDQWAGENYSGTSIAGACEAAKFDGLALESEAPYKADESYIFNTEILINALDRKISSYQQIPLTEIETIKEVIYNKGMLWTAFDVHEEFYSIGGDGMIKSEATYKASNLRGGHAVALCGWKHVDGKLYWQFQNSWGDRFGEDGFFYISADLYSRISKAAYIVGPDKVPSRPGIIFVWLGQFSAFIRSMMKKISEVFK